MKVLCTYLLKKGKFCSLQLPLGLGSFSGIAGLELTSRSFTQDVYGARWCHVSVNAWRCMSPHRLTCGSTWRRVAVHGTIQHWALV